VSERKHAYCGIAQEILKRFKHLILTQTRPLTRFMRRSWTRRLCSLPRKAATGFASLIFMTCFPTSGPWLSRPWSWLPWEIPSVARWSCSKKKWVGVFLFSFSYFYVNCPVRNEFVSTRVLLFVFSNFRRSDVNFSKNRLAYLCVLCARKKNFPYRTVFL